MSLDYAILSFLDFSPMSGYDLKKYFDDSINHFWPATQSHIYRALGQMEDKQWVTHETVAQDGRPDRKVYSITAEGKAHLREWLTTPLPLTDLREAWLIQIFFAHNLSNPEINALLNARIKALREKLQSLQVNAQEALDRNAQRVGFERLSSLWQMTLDYGIDMYQAEIAWLEEAAEKANHLPALRFNNSQPEN